MNILEASEVAISAGHSGYPDAPPYSPAIAYPEYPFGAGALADEANPAYEGVREALRLLGLDAGRVDRPDWNPLGEIVRPGDRVVVKPNFIRHFRETLEGHGDCLFTHGSVIRAIVDYVFIALKGRGRIVIADAPNNDADFDELRRMTGLGALQDLYRGHAGFEVEVHDLRPEMARKIDGVIAGHVRLPGDPGGYVKVDLGSHSAFAEVDHLCHLLYGAEYDKGELRRHHQPGIHEYLVSRTVLAADCVINVPKLKTHKKTGLTAAMKNLVGINGNKNWLPHHREGVPAEGGDEFPDDGLRRRIERGTVAGFKRIFPVLGPLRALLARPAKAFGKRVFGDTNIDTVRSGNWHGNDTTWRMVHDLNRILLYADANGRLHECPVRRVFHLVDAIVAGEANGPLDATPKQVGAILAGWNPVAVDLVCAVLMGFDHRRLPVLRRAFLPHELPLISGKAGDVRCRSNDPLFDRAGGKFCARYLPFRPHFGWMRHVEVQEQADEAGVVS